MIRKSMIRKRLGVYLIIVVLALLMLAVFLAVVYFPGNGTTIGDVAERIGRGGLVDIRVPDDYLSDKAAFDQTQRWLSVEDLAELAELGFGKFCQVEKNSDGAPYLVRIGDLTVSASKNATFVASADQVYCTGGAAQNEDGELYLPLASTVESLGIPLAWGPSFGLNFSFPSAPRLTFPASPAIVSDLDEITFPSNLEGYAEFHFETADRKWTRAPIDPRRVLK